MPGARSQPHTPYCILWEDAPQEAFIKVSGLAWPFTVAYSDLQGGEEGIVNDAPPLLVGAAIGDYQL